MGSPWKHEPESVMPRGERHSHQWRAAASAAESDCAIEAQHCGLNTLVTERRVRAQSVSIVVKNVRSMDCSL